MPLPPLPIDLVTASASGIDPHITPAAPQFQIPRIARERGTTPDRIHDLVEKHTQAREFGVLGEARINVLELNLDLDQQFPGAKQAQLR